MKSLGEGGMSLLPSRSSEEPIISVEGITARFGEETILANVSFQVRRGEIFAILGGAGAARRFS